MKSGLQTLHDIDNAISKARGSVGRASDIPRKTAAALVDIRKKQKAAYDEIATERLGIIDDGDGGDLGYIDRKAEKYLKEHEAARKKLETKLDKAVAKIENLEGQRRDAEMKVQKAVDDYDKAAALAETKILRDPLYGAVLERVELAESTLIRASEKLEIAREDELEKGTPYRQDSFFAYLQKRGYGTKSAKGWFLTKWLDRWVATKIKYRQASENYRRLQAIPKRLENHVAGLEENVEAERAELETLEAAILKREGVTALRKTSLKVQSDLDKIDEKIASGEREAEEIRGEHRRISSGETGPYRDAVNILSDALTRVKLSDLRRLAAQTRSRDDDLAIDSIIDLSRAADEIEDDQKEAKSLIRKYEKTLKELEQIRQRFKSRRYDAPSSIFDSDLVGALLLRVLSGALDGDSLWRQIERAQRTVRRYSDNDFGGGDWTEGLRLPRQSPRTRRSPRRRTSIPRTPRTSLPRVPKISRSSGRGRSGGKSGGFRTGGGF